MKIGIIKEFKTPSDKRVVFTPSKCAAAKKLFPKVEFLINTKLIYFDLYPSTSFL